MAKKAVNLLCNRRMVSSPNNPFSTDSRKPKRPLVTDRNMRDALLRKEFDILSVSQKTVPRWKTSTKHSLGLISQFPNKIVTKCWGKLPLYPFALSDILTTWTVAGSERSRCDRHRRRGVRTLHRRHSIQSR